MAAARAHERIGLLDRTPLLCARLARVPAPLRGHEHADRGGHRRRVSVLGRGDGGAAILRRARCGAGAVLRSGRVHHRTHSARQHVRGARQAADDGGAACPGGPAAQTGPRAAQPQGRGHPHRGARAWRRLRGAPRRARPRGWRSGVRIERGGRVDAHRRVDARREDEGRSRGGWHHQPYRRAEGAGDDAGRTERARSHREADARCPGLARADPDSRRSRERHLRPDGDLDRDRHRRCLGAGQRLAAQGTGGGDLRADHRLSLRDGPRGADGAHGRDGQGRRARRSDQGWRSAAAGARDRRRGAGQDGHDHRGQAHGDGRRPVRWRRRTNRALTRRGRGSAVGASARGRNRARDE